MLVADNRFLVCLLLELWEHQLWFYLLGCQSQIKWSSMISHVQLGSISLCGVQWDSSMFQGNHQSLLAQFTTILLQMDFHPSDIHRRITHNQGPDWTATYRDNDSKFGLSLRHNCRREGNTHKLLGRSFAVSLESTLRAHGAATISTSLWEIVPSVAMALKIRASGKGTVGCSPLWKEREENR